jgi:hypothetical protein
MIYNNIYYDEQTPDVDTGKAYTAILHILSTFEAIECISKEITMTMGLIH